MPKKIDPAPYVGRGGHKMAFALDEFDLDVTGATAVDLGSNVGGFVDCLLQRGAVRVYSVDTSYGTLAWRLRNDERVVVMERTNALHVEIPEPVDVVTVDVGWTRQERILPVARGLLGEGGTILSLVKLQYESGGSERRKGLVLPEVEEAVLARVRASIDDLGWSDSRLVECPLGGGKRNREFFALLRP